MKTPDDELPDFLQDRPLPWPEDSHDLRAVGSDWRSHAVLDWQRDEVWGRMEGYRRAAQILSAHLLKDRADLDAVVFPFAACWRHHVEIRLKVLLVDLQRLFERPIVEQHHHNILQLWNEARPLIFKANPEADRRDPNNVGRVLTQLAALDPLGQDFRYEKRRDGTPSLADVDRLDVRAFHEAMEGVATFLSGVADQVDYELDLRREYEQELRREAPADY